MESIRHTVLQTELSRIESEAQAKSYAIMNKADQLVAAHVFCATINQVEPAAPILKPTVLYYEPMMTCEVLVYVHNTVHELFRRAAVLGMPWSDNGASAFHGARDLRFAGHETVEVAIPNDASASYQQSRVAAA